VFRGNADFAALAAGVGSLSSNDIAVLDAWLAARTVA
jgi:hypothetical protein